jgi:DNA-binding MarR family transcriptional regulator
VPAVEFGFDIGETARLMRRDFDRRSSALGVTRAQSRVLFVLSRHGGVRQVELADILDMEPITLCRMIDRLEEAGLVARHRDEVDRRAWNIHLTEKAGPLLKEIEIIGAQCNDLALTGISDADQKRVRDILSRIRSNLTKGGATPARKVS